MPPTLWLKQQNFLIVLKVRILRPRCWPHWFLLRAMREGCVQGLSPWAVDGHSVSSHSLPFYVFYFLSCCQSKPLLKPVWLGRLRMCLSIRPRPGGLTCLLIHLNSRICWAGVRARHATSAPHIAHLRPCSCPGGSGSPAGRDKKGKKQNE